MRGYSLIEMLIVTALIFILATVPIALLRRSREKTCELEALKSLRMLALAYENYWAQNGHKYPNYVQSGLVLEEEDIEYSNAAEIWSALISERLLPRMYSGKPYDRRDLLARGYQLSIYPADYGDTTGSGARNTYALALMPYEGSLAKRGLAMVRGQKYFSSYPSAIPRQMHGFGLYSLNVYTVPDDDD